MTRASGSLLVDKASGWTSHDVVAKLRGILRERRVGHAGTLDPMATGLLVVAVGPATRLLRFAQQTTKTYEGEILLGSATDSLDADGVVTSLAPVPRLAWASVQAAATAMTGPSMQRPPMVSALKVQGRRLHEIHRAGGEVEREPRPIVVESFDVSATPDPARWRFVVTCSPGTYVRVLASELAERLGTLGHLVQLRRTASGTSRVDDALTLDEVDARARALTLELRPPRELVASLATLTLRSDEVAAVRHGQRVNVGDGLVDGTEVAALDEAGDLVGVLTRSGGQCRPSVVLSVDEPPSPRR